MEFVELFNERRVLFVFKLCQIENVPRESPSDVILFEIGLLGRNSKLARWKIIFMSPQSINERALELEKG